jgi:hypothetical protein
MDENLKKYGRHLKSCELVRQPIISSTDRFWECTCGFSLVLGCKVCNGKGYVVSLNLADYAGKYHADSGFISGNCPECGKI